MHQDEVRIRHILDAVRKAVEFVKGRTRESLDSNEMLSLSLVRLLEIIGEASNRVSPEYRRLHPDIPWDKMAAMRNRLVHGYFDVDLDIVWDTVVEDLPPVLEKLEKLIPPAT